MNNEYEDLKGSILLPRGEENKISKYRVNSEFFVTVMPDRDKGHYVSYSADSYVTLYAGPSHIGKTMLLHDYYVDFLINKRYPGTLEKVED